MDQHGVSLRTHEMLRIQNHTESKQLPLRQFEASTRSLEERRPWPVAFVQFLSGVLGT